MVSLTIFLLLSSLLLQFDSFLTPRSYLNHHIVRSKGTSKPHCVVSVNVDESDKAISKIAVPRRTKIWEKAMIYILSYLLASISANKQACMTHVYIGMDFKDFVLVTKVIYSLSSVFCK